MSNYWGQITWLLIHSLYELINQEQFNKYYLEINKQVLNILNLLPCEYCREHAKQYIKINKFNINEKDLNKMKNFFYKFHNDVNIRLNKSVFYNYEIYKNANIKNIYHNFSILFPKNTYNIRSLGTNLHRKFVVENLKKLLLKLNL